MELPIFNTYMNFSRHQLCCFTVVSFFVLDKSTTWNRCLQQPCFKNLCKIAQASKNSDSNAQHFLLNLLTHSWFHSMLSTLPGYQFPYIVMNMCFYLSPSHAHCWLQTPVRPSYPMYTSKVSELYAMVKKRPVWGTISELTMSKEDNRNKIYYWHHVNA